MHMYYDEFEAIDTPSYITPEGVSRLLYEVSNNGKSLGVYAPKKEYPHMRLARALVRSGMKLRKAQIHAYIAYVIAEGDMDWAFKLANLPFDVLRRVFWVHHQNGEKLQNLKLEEVMQFENVVEEEVWDEQRETYWWEYSYPETTAISYMPGEEYDFGSIPLVPEHDPQAEEIDNLTWRRIVGYLRKRYKTGLQTIRPTRDDSIPEWAQDPKVKTVFKRVRSQWWWWQMETVARCLSPAEIYRIKAPDENKRAVFGIQKKWKNAYLAALALKCFYTYF